MNTISMDIEVNLKVATQLGLLEEEYEKIKKLLLRNPNYTELSLFSVMWSEHCCYKNSLHWLKKLPKEGDQIVTEAGEENAGIVDIGNHLGCVFKIESHNHPSAIEPYQGAATGVGGIHRDIFTMGARPLATLNSLRFGDLELKKTKWLVKGIVKGIGDYGNSFGVPTVGGEIYFDSSYNNNPLVNAMSVGIINTSNIISAIAKGKNNPVYIVGSATGKDGIHGATFASGDLNEDSADQLPAVQVGDPFQEKLLLEASLEAAQSGFLIGMQDMGAAGIACSTSEMSFKGGVGMKIFLDRVPLRQADMKPFEILLSESQERMLVVVKKGNEKDIEAIFEKWDLNCTIIGEVTDGVNLEYYMHSELVASVPAKALVLGGDAPVYKREIKIPSTHIEEIEKYREEDVPLPNNLKEVARFITQLPNIASKKWIYEQYDSMVRTNTTSTNAYSDAATIRIKETGKSLALTVDANSYYIKANPEEGAAIAVAEAARNISCTGGVPLAITNCLNFGNPYNSEVYWQFTGTIKGLSKACKKFNTPVTGGNVSFYNQDEKGSVLPTPVIGMIGILDEKNKMTLDFKQEDNLIFLIGVSQSDLASSQYLIQFHKIKTSPSPYFNLDEEYRLHKNLLSLIKSGLIQSAHDISEGGLFISLLESARIGNFGFDIKTDSNFRKDAFLFGEGQGRVIVSIRENEKINFLKHLEKEQQPHQFLGKVTQGNIQIDNEKFGLIGEWGQLYDEAISRHFEN